MVAPGSGDDSELADIFRSEMQSRCKLEVENVAKKKGKEGEDWEKVKTRSNNDGILLQVEPT